jgi:hypothetical protein
MARIPLGVVEMSLLKTPEVAKIFRPQMPNVPLLDGSLWDVGGQKNTSKHKMFWRSLEINFLYVLYVLYVICVDIPLTRLPLRSWNIKLTKYKNSMQWQKFGF